MPSVAYDANLLADAPEATAAARQEGYNVKLLQAPAPKRSKEELSTKPLAPNEDYAESGLRDAAPFDSDKPNGGGNVVVLLPTPWYKTKKGVIILAVVAIAILAAAIGGGVGGALGGKKKNNNATSSGPGGPNGGNIGGQSGEGVTTPPGNVPAGPSSPVQSSPTLAPTPSTPSQFTPAPPQPSPSGGGEGGLTSSNELIAGNSDEGLIGAEF